MDTTAQRSHAVIVHRNPIIAQDLRECLMEAGALDIEVVPVLEEVRSLGAPILVIAGQFEELSGNHAVETWRGTGTQVVIVDGYGAEGRDLPPGLHVLETPFGSDDVVRLVRGLKIF